MIVNKSRKPVATNPTTIQPPAMPHNIDFSDYTPPDQPFSQRLVDNRQKRKIPLNLLASLHQSGTVTSKSSDKVPPIPDATLPSKGLYNK